MKCSGTQRKLCAAFLFALFQMHPGKEKHRKSFLKKQLISISESYIIVNALDYGF